MPQLPPERAGGSALAIRGEEVVFSFWPMRRTTRRWGLHSMLYAADPWSVMQTAAQQRCRQAELDAALSFIRQAREYFLAADAASAIETKPLLYYYSFLNLAKALGLAARKPNLIGSVFHGLTHPYTTGERITTAQLDVKANAVGGRTNVFDVLHEVLTGTPLAGNLTIPVAHLLPQSVVGHRLWCEAGGTVRRERFIAVSRVRLLEDGANRTIWTTLEVPTDTLQRLGRTLRDVATQSDLDPNWRPVTDGLGAGGRPMRQFEQVTPVVYNHRAADSVVTLVDAIRPRLHRTILSAAPYRRYYLYLSPAGETRLHQLLVVHALMFFLGSLTRYRPTYLLAILDGEYGGFTREFLATQPLQYVYGIASEFCQREVSRAQVV